MMMMMVMMRERCVENQSRCFALDDFNPDLIDSRVKMRCGVCVCV